MDEFLRQYYYLITHGVEFLAAVTGLYCLKKYRSTAANYFIYLLIYVFIIDFVGRYPSHLRTIGLFNLIENSDFKKNYWWYNIFERIGVSLFLSIIYYYILSSRTKRKIVKYSIYLILSIDVFYCLFNIDSIIKTSDVVLTFLNLSLILISLILYFLEVLQGDKILNFYKELYFYISATILIWYLLTTPLVFYEIYFKSADWNFVFLKWQIYLFANIFMYLSFTFALIYCKPEND